MLIEIIKFIFLTFLIVIISKELLVTVLRKIAETMNLSSKVVGNIAGFATSAPELLTVSFAAYAGLLEASSYNILSSNIINLLQYSYAIYINKNQKILLNKALKIDLVLVGFTIIIPLLIFFSKIDYDLNIVPLFILLAVFFYYINNNCHKMYLKNEDSSFQSEEKNKKNKILVIISYIISLILIVIALYFVGKYLTICLTKLCIGFGIPQIIIGVILGFITSIPELVTFLESQRFYKKKNIEENELGVIEATNNLLSSNISNVFIIQTLGIIIFSLRF